MFIMGFSRGGDIRDVGVIHGGGGRTGWMVTCERAEMEGRGRLRHEGRLGTRLGSVDGIRSLTEVVI